MNASPVTADCSIGLPEEVNLFWQWQLAGLSFAGECITPCTWELMAVPCHLLTYERGRSFLQAGLMLYSSCTHEMSRSVYN